LSSAFFRLRVEGRTGPHNKTAVIFQSLLLHQFNARPFRLGVLSPHTKTRHVHFKHLVHNSGRNSGCGTPHGCMDLLVFTTRSLLPFCVIMDVLCSGCLQPSLYCLSVSAWIYRALGVHSIVMTAFLFPHGCIVLCVHSQVITAFLCQHGCIVFCVHNQVITAFLSQH